MTGATGFNQIARGLPGLNRSVMSDRLRHLERSGLVAKGASPVGGRHEYVLSDAGDALRPTIMAIGEGSSGGGSPSLGTSTWTCHYSSGACIRAWTRPHFPTARSASSFGSQGPSLPVVGSTLTGRAPEYVWVRRTETSMWW